MPASIKTIGIAACASGCPQNALAPAEKYFKDRGIAVKTGACVYQNTRFLSAPDAMRARELNDFYKDGSVDAVFAARGGYGSARMLDLIDYDAVKSHPKLFVGLSDTTAVQNAFLAKAGVESLTGCVLYRRDGVLMPPVTEKTLWQAVNGEEQRFDGLQTMRAGKAKGRLIGGCLTIFASLLGTPYMPDANGAIVLIEDVGEQPYVIDRLLTQCALAGVFDKAAGVVFGDFYRCESKDASDGEIRDVLDEWRGKLKIPAVKGLPYGHAPDSVVLPLGRTVDLDASAGVLHIQKRSV